MQNKNTVGWGGVARGVPKECETEEGKDGKDELIR